MCFMRGLPARACTDVLQLQSWSKKKSVILLPVSHRVQGGLHVRSHEIDLCCERARGLGA